jgi:PPOX class probable F420-dependent enzyme
MATQQGDPALLNDPVAQELLQSRIPARLAYTWPDGSPRVVPIWFHWNGEDVVMAGPSDAPKVAALRADPRVAITIDDASGWPYRVLLLRGDARVEVVAGVAPEYAAAAERYFGPEQGRAWVANVGQLSAEMARIAVRPDWVGLLDFEGRFLSAIASKMGQG